MQVRLGREIPDTAAKSLSDFTARLLDLANRARSVGDYAVAVGDGRLALQAGKQEGAHLLALMTKLGIESSEALSEYEDAKQYVSAIGRVIRANAIVAKELAAELDMAGEQDLAADVRAIAPGLEQKELR